MVDTSDCTLEELSRRNCTLYHSLLHSLDVNSTWKQLLTTLQSNGVFISNTQIQKMEISPNPSMILLQELQNRYASVDDLCMLLRQSNLLDSLSVLSEPEPLQIVKQPGEDEKRVDVIEGTKLTLECKAVGLPPPSYQWHCDNVELTGQTSSILSVHNMREENCGEYFCIVSHKVPGELIQIESNRVPVVLKEHLPRIIVNLPQTVTLCQGADLELGLWVEVKPTANYEWMFKNSILTDHTSYILQIKNIDPSQEGEYKCRIYNSAGELFSRTCKVNVYVPPEGVNTKNTASAKVALLIGNSRYDNLSDLYTPYNDVKLLSRKLAQIGFHVIPLIDLTLNEMINAVKWFCQMLPPNAYGFFYFVGHGFQRTNKYMMPVDCPDSNSFQCKDCFCELFLIKEALTTKAKLFIMILDMCLSVPDSNEYIKTENEPYVKYNRNVGCSLIKSFATSSQLLSYEIATKEYGLYAEHLSKFLDKDYPITTVIQKAHEEFAHCEVHQQKPSMFSDDTKNYRLTDSVYGDTALEEKMNMLKHIPSTSLNFTRIGLYTKVRVTPYRNCFLNCVDIMFRELKGWKLAIITNPKDIRIWFRKYRDGEDVCTLVDIQKANAKIGILVDFNVICRKTNKVVDSDTLDLGRIFIISKDLWFERQQLE